MRLFEEIQSQTLPVPQKGLDLEGFGPRIGPYKIEVTVRSSSSCSEHIALYAGAPYNFLELALFQSRGIIAVKMSHLPLTRL